MSKLNELPTELQNLVLDRVSPEDLSELWKDNQCNRGAIQDSLAKLHRERLPSWSGRDLKLVASDILTQSSLELKPFLHESLELTANERIIDVSDVDIHPSTKRGVVGITIGTHSGPDSVNGNLCTQSSRIVLCEYPSWNVIKTIRADGYSKLTHIQTIRAPVGQCTESEYMTIFSVLAGRSHRNNDMICFRLYDDNQIHYVGSMYEYDVGNMGAYACSNVIHLKDVFFYSQVRESEGGTAVERVTEWLPILCKDVTFEPKDNLFATVIGESDSNEGITKIFKFDMTKSKALGSEDIIIRNDSAYINIGDLSISRDDRTQPFHTAKGQPLQQMIRFPPELNHLSATCWVNGKVDLYDWRFGVCVGSLPSEGEPKLELRFNFAETQEGEVRGDEPTDEEEWQRIGRTSFKITTLLPRSCNRKVKDLGLRLVAFTYGSSTRRWFKSWDISYLLDVKYDPFANSENETGYDYDAKVDSLFEDAGEGYKDIDDFKEEYGWWDGAADRLKEYAITTEFPNSRVCNLPYSPADGNNFMVANHGISWNDYVVDCFDIFKNSAVFSVHHKKSNAAAEFFVDIETGMTVRHTNRNGFLSRMFGGETRESIRVLNDSEIVVYRANTLMHGSLE